MKTNFSRLAITLLILASVVTMSAAGPSTVHCPHPPSALVASCHSVCLASPQTGGVITTCSQICSYVCSRCGAVVEKGVKKN